MKRRQFIASVLIALALLGCGEAPRLQPVSAGSTVLAFGDSVTHGTGAGAGEDWPTLLAGQTGWNVINAGIAGDTAVAGKGRIADLLETHRPELVIVEIGGNDFLRRRAQGEVKEDLRAILQQVARKGARAVLVAVPELSLMGVLAGRPVDAPIYAQLAEEEGVPLIPDVFADVLSQPELCADRIHPNAAGYAHMVAGILAELRRIGLAR